MNNIIEASSVHYRYDEGHDILKGVSFSVSEGDFIAILGHNGSGKSTLIKLFNGILLPSEGSLTVCGMNVSDPKNLLEIRKNVGMVFQNPDNQIISSIVEEDVAFALENLGVPHAEMRDRVDRVLTEVGMEDYRKHSTTKLSGGQKQRVAIAGILAMEPKILVLDEPTAMLDPKGRSEVLKVIHDLNNRGITVIMITHYMEEAAKAKRCFVLNDGMILLDGTPAEVFQNVALLRSIGLDVPSTVDLMFELRRHGCKVPISVLDSQECVTFIKRLLEGKIMIGD